MPNGNPGRKKCLVKRRHDRCNCNSPLRSLFFSLNDLDICPSTLPCKQLYGNRWRSIRQTCPKYRRHLISSFWATSSWLFGEALMSLFRLRCILVTPAVLLKPSISNTLSLLCVSAVTVHVSVLYISILSARDSYTLTSVVIAMCVAAHIVCSLLTASTASPGLLPVSQSADPLLFSLPPMQTKSSTWFSFLPSRVTLCSHLFCALLLLVLLFSLHWSSCPSWSFLQWRSKALRGPCSTVTWGPSLSLPSTSPSLAFPSSSPAQPLHPAAKWLPNPARGSVERCKLPRTGSGVEPQPKSNLVHFSLKIRHVVATILMIFLRVLPKKIFCGPTTRGPRSSGAPVSSWGPGSLNRLNPHFLRHWLSWAILSTSSCTSCLLSVMVAISSANLRLFIL